MGVVRKDSGVLHFFVNGEDQGPAASAVPDRVYGVIDLYGQAAQATIIDGNDFRSPDGLGKRHDRIIKRVAFFTVQSQAHSDFSPC